MSEILACFGRVKQHVHICKSHAAPSVPGKPTIPWAHLIRSDLFCTNNGIMNG